ncbi:DNA mismatch repair endonuclease MutL [Paenibacillus humicola]|uniref:DNA mismatch repair endonuclease MutL n=1 Tax=Paenibacillus humicola TaxID=3110540 RepID=UPI00237B67C7|nr:DNA mismatch repair endonuclease MutL [Paenibacillus humicola]
MGKIQVLDEQLANQIAAGEVVERPASVVKELVENAIDAGATTVDVTVEEGGLALVRVTDNGSGIEAGDMETAFFRHATSKLSSGKDLFRIASLGFRGEALPSIAAVSRVECVSSAETTGLGRKLVIEGGTVRSNEETSAPRGTDISVRDLFYNTPARLKYMKTIQTEIGHIADYVNRLALAHPGIAFTLKHNGGLLLRTIGGGDRLQAFAAIYGTSSAKSMLPVEGEHPDYDLRGFISKPELTRASRGGITVVVNGRYIRSFVVNQALLQAYHTLLPINRYPLAVLELGMHPSLVDVNVHPSKMEVRFSKEGELKQFIETALGQALGRQRHIPGPAPERSKPVYVQEQISFHRPEPSFGPAADASGGRPPLGAPSPSASWRDGQPDGSRRTPVSGRPAASGGGAGYAPEERGRTPIPRDAAERLYAPVQREGTDTADAVYETAAALDYGFRPAASVYDRPPGDMPELDKRVPAAEPPAAAGELPPAPDVSSSRSAGGEDRPAFPELYWIGQLHGTYIVAQNEEGLFLIDQHAAHERIHYEYYLDKFGRPEPASQPLLVPLTLEFTPAEAAALAEKLGALAAVGVELEPFGTNTFLVRACPEWFPRGEEQAIVEEMAEWLLGERGAIEVGKLREKSAIMCSCKASIKANDRLTREEGEGLLRRLAACRMPYTCPHGRPIVVHITAYQLEKMFKRVMS